MEETLSEKLYRTRDLTDEELLALLQTDAYDSALFSLADRVRQAHYGKAVYLRGLIELTNICKNNCLYCGIRAGNRKVSRYRLTPEDILSCCREGYRLGFRTFVLQGGEDPWFTDDRLVPVVADIRREFPDCAITLSLGERSRESYQRLYDAGANRYLLRHEAADPALYAKLHPVGMELENRLRCLSDLKAIGYQVGAGFMVGAPWQTTEHLVADLRYLQDLDPDMIGIGPFIHHKDTPLRAFPDGTLALTVRLLAVLRLMFPCALIPATTALGTIAPDGREQGLRAGANVIMPNLSPASVRKKYALYEGKLCTGDEGAEAVRDMKARIAAAGYEAVDAVGDVRREA